MFGFLKDMFQFFNTDGTPMLGDSGIDIEGKVFGQTNESLFSNDNHFDSSNSGGGFGSDF